MSVNFAPLFTQDQLAIACGGADKLLQLSKDKSAQGLSGTVAQAFIAEVMAASTGDVCSILQVTFNPADPTFAGAAVVQLRAVTYGLYWAWHKSTGGVAIPPDVKQAKEDADAALRLAAEGLRALGTTVDPASNAGAETVTVDKTGTRILRQNMSGFC